MAYEQRVGDWRFVCDISGFDGWASDSVIQWNGLRVLKRFAEERQPQDFVKAVRDDQTVSNPRPVQPYVFITERVTPEDL